MIDFTKPVETMRGEKVTILSTEAEGDWPIVGQIAGEIGIFIWNRQGKSQCYWPIRNKPNVVTGYLNIYNNLVSDIHLSRKVADRQVMPYRSACIRITYQEGQFDE